jgi:hypothetical protein
MSLLFLNSISDRLSSINVVTLDSGAFATGLVCSTPEFVLLVFVSDCNGFSFWRLYWLMNITY